MKSPKEIFNKYRDSKIPFLLLALIDALIFFVPLEVLATLYFQNKKTFKQKIIFISLLALARAGGAILALLFIGQILSLYNFQANDFEILRKINARPELLYFLIFICAFSPALPILVSYFLASSFYVPVLIFFFIIFISSFSRFFCFFVPFLYLKGKYPDFFKSKIKSLFLAIGVFMILFAFLYFLFKVLF